MDITTGIRRHSIAAGIGLAAVISSIAAQGETIPLKAATMIIEYNASAEDIGVQFFMDSDGWSKLTVGDPGRNLVFQATARGALTKQGGGTEIFLESVEPELAELSLQQFFKRFPEGNYRFRAVDNEGTVQIADAKFNHDIPAGPEISLPLPEGDAECAANVPLPVVIAWNAVTTSIEDEPLDVVRYEVIVENDDVNFDVKVPADPAPQMTVPFEALQPGTEYAFEVLAVAQGGNQTITEGCFITAL